MLSASMMCPPSSVNIRATRDFPVAIPPVNPTLSMDTPQHSNLGSGPFRAPTRSSHLRGLHGVRHQHRNCERPDPTGYRCNRTRDFCHFRVHVADENRTFAEKYFPSLCIYAKKTRE